jgi:hypothetical protein
MDSDHEEEDPLASIQEILEKHKKTLEDSESEERRVSI